MNANIIINNSRNFNDLMLYFILKDSIFGFERGVPCDYKYSRRHFKDTVIGAA